MKLFFETDIQSICFLMTLPIGFALALFLDGDAFAGRFRFAADFLCVLAAGMALVIIVIRNGENDLRLYHLLGLSAGAVLYLGGVGQIWRALSKRIEQKKRKRQDNRRCMEKSE